MFRFVTFLLLLISTSVMGQSLPDGYWPAEKTQPLLDKTIFLKLSPNLSHLADGERAGLEKLIAAGKIFHELYLRQKHESGVEALKALQQLDEKMGSPVATQNLIKLYWLSKGPIVTTLDNKRLAFVPAGKEIDGKAVYPPSVDRKSLDKLMELDRATRDALMDVRSVVQLVKDAPKYVAILEKYPVLATLHSGFAERVRSLSGGDGVFAVPYAVEYADEIVEIYGLLTAAADDIHPHDREFAGYLRNRARDLLSSNYESGDASWVTGKFGNLNAQIGSYETYDDALYGVKAFYSMSILARDPQRSAALAKAIGDIQKIEDSLPYEHQKRVRDNIPVHVCNVIADFGQARGTNTATILPNDAEHSRKYGRTILLRYNIMTHPALFDLSAKRFRTAVEPEFRSHLVLQSNFQRTLWHEVGHYLGVDRTEDGRQLDEGLQQYSDLFEEMKADLVSLFAANRLHKAGVHSKQDLRAIYAGGILRVLQLVKPRQTQPYQTMQLIQWNYFLENGLLKFNANSGLLSIDYEVYHKVVTQLLKEVLAIQRAGSPSRAADFVKQYTPWKEDLHEVIATRLRAATTYRYRHVTYAALDE
jgi:hypothetical protein